MPSLVQGLECCTARRRGTQKKDAALEIVSSSINMADAVSAKHIADAPAVYRGPEHDHRRGGGVHEREPVGEACRGRARAVIISGGCGSYNHACRHPNPLVGVIMGSRNDYAVMRAAVEILREFGVPYEARVVSAHRTPELMFAMRKRPPGAVCGRLSRGRAGRRICLGWWRRERWCRCLGVPIPATALQGMDSLLSIVQMPKGVPVATFAIGAAGAANAALFAVAMLAEGGPCAAREA